MGKEFIEKVSLREINKGSSLYNTILCLIALNNAKDFYTHRPLNTGTFRDARIHDHHIFPKKMREMNPDFGKTFMETNGSILNRTLLLDETNEKIQNKGPKKYLEEFSIECDRSGLDLMASHFISEAGLNYLMVNDYNNFIDEREKTIKGKLIELIEL